MQKKLLEIYDLLNKIDSNHTIYKCEQENFCIYYNTVIASISQLAYCKFIFKKNRDVAEFFQKVFNIAYPKYVTKNKSLLLGRTIKHFSEIDNSEEILEILNKLYEIISKLNKDTYDKNELTWQNVIDSIKVDR